MERVNAPVADAPTDLAVGVAHKSHARYLSHHLKGAEALVEHFLEDTRSQEVGFTTWQDMVRLAQEYGVSRVVQKPLSVAGISMPIDLGKVILINEGDAPARQRFTLAHEVAHLFLDPETTRQVWLRAPDRANDRVHDALESFCDDLAARMLMPRTWVLADLKDQSPMPQLLLQRAYKYGVSSREFCIRAVGLLNGAYHVSEWRNETEPNSGHHLQRVWQVAARGMRQIAPERTGLRSPIGEMFMSCIAEGIGSPAGNVVSRGKNEFLEIRGTIVRRDHKPSMLAVARRAKPVAKVA